MKVQELRIGNYLERDVFLRHVVVKIDARNIFDIWKETKEYQPILLTEERLLKFGFEKKGTNAIFWTLNNVDVWELNGGFANDLDLPIQYVHQLQNLYFALTGEELIYDEWVVTKDNHPSIVDILKD
jgi:hypothetical protein